MAMIERGKSASGFQISASLDAVRCSDLMSEYISPYFSPLYSNNGASISIKAGAHERYAPSFQGQGVCHPLRLVFHRRRRRYGKDGA